MNMNERCTRYKSYIASDLGLLDLDKYDAMNGNIPDHLCEIGAFIKTYNDLIDKDLLSGYYRLLEKYRLRLFKDIPEEKDIVMDLYLFWQSLAR